MKEETIIIKKPIDILKHKNCPKCGTELKGKGKGEGYNYCKKCDIEYTFRVETLVI